jgi:hypothetical protein
VKKLLWGKAGALRVLTSGRKLSGADPGTIAFSMIQIVDVAANDFATEDNMVKEMEELPQLKQSALAKARPFFEQYGLIEGNTGVLVYQLPEERTWQQIARREKTADFDLTDAHAQSFHYRVFLESREVESAHCPDRSYPGEKPWIFTLSVHGQDFDRTLQVDKVFYR